MDNKQKIELPSNKKFGYFFSLIFLILALYLYYIKSNFFYTFIPITTLSLIIFLIASFKEEKLHMLNLIWFKFGISLGKIITPILLSFIFFIIITPIAIVAKIFGRDELNLKYNQEKSYFQNRKNKSIKPSTFKNQF